MIILFPALLERPQSGFDNSDRNVDDISRSAVRQVCVVGRQRRRMRDSGVSQSEPPSLLTKGALMSQTVLLKGEASRDGSSIDVGT